MGLLGWIDRKIVEAQTCPGCGCNADRWRDNCNCLRQGCSCAGAEEDDNPDWEREPGPDAAIVDAATAPVDLPPTAPAYVPVSKSDPEAAQLAQAHNRATFLRRTATTPDERLEARRAQEFADGEQAAYEHRRRAAETQPPEPPMGTVLETRDQLEDYRIERTDDGWLLQYRVGESPDGSRLHSGFANRGISWAAAWSAWGPPNGAEPFREVPADAPLLPAHPDEPLDDVLLGPDASDGRFEDGGGLPPAAEPYTPPSPTTTTGSAGGAGMPNIEEARSGVMGAKGTGESALAELAQAHSSLEDTQNALRHATEGSNQPEADQAHALLAEAMSKIDEARSQVASALQEFEGVATRL